VFLSYILGPTFSALLTVSALLTGAVGIYFLYNQNTWPLQSVMGAGHYTVEYFKYCHSTALLTLTRFTAFQFSVRSRALLI
jgi:hypothetical protein